MFTEITVIIRKSESLGREKIRMKVSSTVAMDTQLKTPSLHAQYCDMYHKVRFYSVTKWDSTFQGSPKICQSKMPGLLRPLRHVFLPRSQRLTYQGEGTTHLLEHSYSSQVELLAFSPLPLPSCGNLLWIPWCVGTATLFW